MRAGLSLKRVAATLPFLKPKRQKFDNQKKLEILEYAKTHGVHAAVRIAHNTPGYESVNRYALCRWRKALLAPAKRMGRPPCSDAFASAVLQNLIFGSVEKINEQARLTIEANVAYGLDIVKHAAREAQKRAEFQGDRKVQSYKFSSSWVRTWVKNMKLRRRRVTTTTKVLPPAEQVQEKMLFIQEHLIDFDLDEIISADETGFNYGALPLNQFVPCDADRATAPASDEKARFCRNQTLV